jgi:Na+-driven multidrug efflux pump
MVSAVLRGMGDAKRPFLFIGIASAVNLVLDIVFTGFLGWGVAGAAWATIIGQAVSFLFSLFYLFRRREAFGFDFKRESFIPKPKYTGMIASLGTPMAIQSGCINLSMLVVNAMIRNTVLSLSVTAILALVTIGVYLVDSSLFAGAVPEILSAISLFDRLTTFQNGMFDLTAIIFYLSVCGLFVYLTVQSLEKKRWN